jgi:hypothetical protein
MAKINPIQLQKFLKGINYPVSKDDLVRGAEKNGATKEICDVLSGLSNNEFQTPAEVSQAVSHANAN